MVFPMSLPHNLGVSKARPSDRVMQWGDLVSFITEESSVVLCVYILLYMLSFSVHLTCNFLVFKLNNVSWRSLHAAWDLSGRSPFFTFIYCDYFHTLPMLLSSGIMC